MIKKALVPCLKIRVQLRKIKSKKNKLSLPTNFLAYICKAVRKRFYLFFRNFGQIRTPEISLSLYIVTNDLFQMLNITENILFVWRCFHYLINFVNKPSKIFATSFTKGSYACNVIYMSTRTIALQSSTALLM